MRDGKEDVNAHEAASHRKACVKGDDKKNRHRAQALNIRSAGLPRLRRRGHSESGQQAAEKARAVVSRILAAWRCHLDLSSGFKSTRSDAVARRLRRAA